MRYEEDLLGGAYDSPRIVLSALVYLLAPPTSGRWIDVEKHGDEIMEAVRAAMLR